MSSELASGTDGDRVHIGSSERRGNRCVQREQAATPPRRLAIIRHAEEVSGSVARTCRYYGISRPTFYKWLRRYEELGIEGLRDRSRAAAHEPKRHKRPRSWQDRLPAPELPLRTSQDRDVSEALPRRPDQPFGDLADPEAPGHEPAALKGARTPIRLKTPHRPVASPRP